MSILGFRQSTPSPDAMGRRIAHLQALHRIGVALSSTMKPHEIIRMVLSEVMELTGAACSTIYLLDHQRQLLVPTLSFGEDVTTPLDLGTSSDLAVQVAHTGHPAQETETSAISCGTCREDSTELDGPRVFCRLCVPLIAGDEVLGIIDLKSDSCTRVESDMEEMIDTLASQAALVLRNASTHEELEQHYSEISLLYEIQQELTSTLEYQKVLESIVERTRRLLDASECTIRLIEERDAKRCIRVAATTGRMFIGPDVLPFEQALIDQQVFGGELLSIDDVRTDARFPDREDAIKAGVVSMLCAPLVVRRKVIGTIRLYTAERREFSVSDRKMLLAVAGQAAVAIEHARLYRQIESKNRDLLASNVELRKTQKELVKKEKLAALGEMAATVAHEIRNPLTSVRGFAQRIARKYSNTGDGRLVEYTTIIIEEVDRLNKFIKDVLDFARRATPEFERVGVNKLLSDIINLMRDELTAQSIVVISDLEMNLRETVVDEALMKQVFLNLLQNARQAMSKGGVLIVRTQNSGADVRIRLADDGSGIPKAILQKIWTPFYTTKTQGTGLGLSLVQRIIDDHHGRIYIRSRVGTGTVVDIFLPVAHSQLALQEA
ncbi:MAG: GAF domain-containing protein [Candidatus Sumerlaeaceae bacterium]